MAQAIVDPQDMLLFAQELRDLNGELHTKLSTIKVKFDQLGDTWRDREQEKFAQEFEQTLQVLAHFMGVVEEQIPFLVRKAEAAQHYLDQQ